MLEGRIVNVVSEIVFVGLGLKHGLRLGEDNKRYGQMANIL